MEENKFKGLWRPRVIWRQKQSAESRVKKTGRQRAHLHLEAWRDVFIDKRSLGEPGVQLPLVLCFTAIPNSVQLLQKLLSTVNRQSTLLHDQDAGSVTCLVAQISNFLGQSACKEFSFILNVSRRHANEIGRFLGSPKLCKPLQPQQIWRAAEALRALSHGNHSR